MNANINTIAIIFLKEKLCSNAGEFIAVLYLTFRHQNTYFHISRCDESQKFCIKASILSIIILFPPPGYFTVSGDNPP